MGNRKAGCGVRAVLGTAGLLWIGVVHAQSASPSFAEQQELRERAAREAREREQRQALPDVSREQPAAATDLHSLELPDEEPCFTLQQLQLDGAHLGQFAFLQRYLDRYRGRCVGQQGIALIVRRASDLALAKGYVTTRIGLPEQSLGSGTLRLQLVPGVIRQIRFNAEEVPDSMWKSAFPARPGDVLNLRALEQGLEQLKRVPSQDVNMELVPGEAPGESDVVISIRHGKRWRASVSLDDAGSRATGKQQVGATAWVDNLARVNDLLSIGVSSDGSADKGRGTHGFNASWSVPLGNWRFSTSTYSSRYKQTIASNADTFASTGTSSNVDLAVERLLVRGQSYRSGIELRVAQRSSHSYVEGVEIEGQRRRTTSVELALLHRQYLGRVQADIRLAHRRGVPWLGGDDDAVGRDDLAPTFRYGLTTLDIGAGGALTSGPRPLAWNTALRYQWSKDTLYGSEFISVGGRYTVNGFDGEVPLGGSRGGYWRNSISWMAHRAIAPYAGIDIGHIERDDRQGIGGGTLSGAHLGARGELGGLAWDGFVGVPMSRPAWLKHEARGHVIGFRASWQF